MTLLHHIAKQLTDVYPPSSTRSTSIQSSGPNPGSYPRRATSIAARPLIELRPASSSASALPKSASVARSTTPIDIGSSSAILDADNFDSDSYDAAFLQSQTETVLPRAQVTVKAEKKPAAPSAVLEAGRESDDELPDISVEMAKDAKRRALAAKKAALVMKQQVRADESQERRREAHETMPDYRAKGKGKAMMDLDGSSSDDGDTSDLEIVLPKKEQPTIAPVHKDKKPFKHAIQGFAGPARPKRDQTPDVTDSQVARAGRTFGKTLVDPHVAARAAKSSFGGQHPQKRGKPAQITGQQLNAHLLSHASVQGQKAVWERKEDWKRRGGTFREDDSHRTETAADETEDAEQGEGEKVIERLQKKADADDAEEDDDEEQDANYVGSDDEAQEEAEVRSVDMDFEGSDRGSGSEAEAEEAGSAAEEDEEATQEPPPAGQADTARVQTDETERVGSASPTTMSAAPALPSRKALYTTSAEDLSPLPRLSSEVGAGEDDEEEEAVFRRPMTKTKPKSKAAMVIDEDEEDEASRSAKIDTAAGRSRSDGYVDVALDKPTMATIADLSMPAASAAVGLNELEDIFGTGNADFFEEGSTQLATAAPLPQSQLPEVRSSVRHCSDAVLTLAHTDVPTRRPYSSRNTRHAAARHQRCSSASACGPARCRQSRHA